LAVWCSFQPKADPPWTSEQLETIAQALSALLKDEGPEVRQHAAKER
jgi:hypothetical protein